MWIKEVKVTTVREEGFGYKICQPASVAEYWQTGIVNAPWFDADKECVVALLLNSQNEIVSHVLVSIGTLDGAIVQPREVYRAAIVSAAHKVVLIHNHPSGDVRPSFDDKQVTQQLRAAGEVIGIPLVDHLIVSSDGKAFYSMVEYGDLEANGGH